MADKTTGDTPQTTEKAEPGINRRRGHDEVMALLRAAARHPYKGPHDTDSSMLRAAAKRLNAGYEPGGTWAQQTVARLCETVASLIEDDQRTPPEGH